MRRTPPTALLPIRLFLAAGWGRGGIEKLIDLDWWNGTVIRDFLATQQPHMLGAFARSLGARTPGELLGQITASARVGRR